MQSIKSGNTELRHLRYLVGLADYGNFRRAAAALHISQPTLSHQIAQLELQFGTKLLDRIGRKSRITAAGHILVSKARSMLRELEEARREINELNDLDGGELRLGAVATINVFLTPNWISRFAKLHPKVKISVRELSIDELESQLSEGAIDLGLGFWPARLPKIDGLRLFQEHLIGIVTSKHPFAGRKRIPLDTFVRQPLVLLSHGFCTHELYIAEQHQSIVTGPIIEMSSVESVLATVKHTNSATILPDTAACWDHHQELETVILTGERRTTREVAFLWPARTNLCRAAQEFIRLVQELQGWLKEIPTQIRA
jgi:LysR family cyn operon transcriptional activator